MPTATISQYKSLLAVLTLDHRKALNKHLSQVASACDDQESRSWVCAFSRIAKGEPVSAEDQDLQDVFRLMTRVQAGKVTPPHIASAGASGIEEMEGSNLRQRPKVHVYGTSAALCFELDYLRDLRAQEQRATLIVEAAAATSTNQYDWQRKISIQLGARELPQLVACMMGWSLVWTAKGHGFGHDKALTVRNQEQERRIQVVLQQRERALSVPIPLPDTYQILALAMKALCANDPHLTSDSALQFCKRSAL